MVKLLIGGSPCTHWSVARPKGREIEAKGIGWELFQNYVTAKNLFQPDVFLYENNWSASDDIKAQIEKELNVPLLRFNSALLSAQNRDRFYAVNFPVKLPEDKELVLKDILLPIKNVPKKYHYNDTPYIPLYPLGQRRVWGIMDIKGMDVIKRIYNIDFKAPTLTCDGSGGHRVKKIYQNGVIRKLTPVEYERLQTLPDNYTDGISDSRRYNCVGNGWTADVITYILQGGLKNVDKNEKIIVISMYDGIGTGRYCLEKLGFTNIEYHAFEIDEYAIKIAKKNFPDIIEHGNAFNVEEEIRKIKTEF